MAARFNFEQQLIVVVVVSVLYLLFASAAASSQEQQKQPPFKLNHAKLRELYYADLVNNNNNNNDQEDTKTLILRGNDPYEITAKCNSNNTPSSNQNNRSSLNAYQLTSRVTSDSGRRAVLIEITGFTYLFNSHHQHQLSINNNSNSNSNISNSSDVEEENNSRPSDKIENLINLFFPLSEYNQKNKIEQALSMGRIKRGQFRLRILNMSGNGLVDSFLDGYSLSNVKPSLVYTSLLNEILLEFFSNLRVLELSHNAFRHLERRHFGIFAGTTGVSQLETLKFDHNELRSIRHDAFYDLINLKYVDFSHNRLKLIHPFTFTICSANIVYIDFSNNTLRALFSTTPIEKSQQRKFLLNQGAQAVGAGSNLNETSSVNLTAVAVAAVAASATTSNDQYQYEVEQENLANLTYLYLSGNDDLKCDCGLLWIYRLKKKITLDDFNCQLENVTLIIEQQKQQQLQEQEPSNNASNSSTKAAVDFRSSFQLIAFSSIKNESLLLNKCRMPNLVVNTENLDKSSKFTLFRWLSRTWFAWNVFPDYIPPLIPFPYLMSDYEIDFNYTRIKSPNAKVGPLKADNTAAATASSTANTNSTTSSNSTATTAAAALESHDNSNKHIFYTWRMSDVVFDCYDQLNNDTHDAANYNTRLKSAIIWKTQYGYLSYLDRSLAYSLREEYDNLGEESDDGGGGGSGGKICPRNQTASGNNNNDDDEDEIIARKQLETSFQIFFKLNKLTKIHQMMSITISSKFGTQTTSEISVNERNQLRITNIRQVVAGPIVCIALNANGIRTYEFDINMRTGIGENFIYSLFISLISCIVPTILGIIICCYCEYEADKNYPMTPPCYPTPMVSTPPNFDINEWMSNAASYLPNLNISETLDQVSKKLRKGMEKASVTVKSLGVTSSAYIYSMYEQSSQRLSDIKSSLPTMSLNVSLPTMSMPTMRYPPMGNLANRMRMGMGNMFFHFKEFCGTTDLTHTPSIVDIVDIDTNASKAIGKGYIIDQINLKKQQNTHYKFLSFIREESQRAAANSNMATSSSSDKSSTKPSSSSSSSSSTPTTSGLTSAKTAAAVAKEAAEVAAAVVDYENEVREEANSSSTTYKGSKQISTKNFYVPFAAKKKPVNEYSDDDDDDDDDEEIDSSLEYDETAVAATLATKAEAAAEVVIASSCDYGDQTKKGETSSSSSSVNVEKNEERDKKEGEQHATEPFSEAESVHSYQEAKEKEMKEKEMKKEENHDQQQETKHAILVPEKPEI